MSTPTRYVINIGPVEGAAAAADEKKFLWPTGVPELEIVSCSLVPHDTTAADATNYSTFVLANTTKSQTLQTEAGTTIFTKGVARNADLSAITKTNLRIAAADMLTATKAESGTGSASSVGFRLVVEEVR